METILTLLPMFVFKITLAFYFAKYIIGVFGALLEAFVLALAHWRKAKELERENK